MSFLSLPQCFSRICGDVHLLFTSTKNDWGCPYLFVAWIFLSVWLPQCDECLLSNNFVVTIKLLVKVTLTNNSCNFLKLSWAAADFPHVDSKTSLVVKYYGKILTLWCRVLLFFWLSFPSMSFWSTGPYCCHSMMKAPAQVAIQAQECP